MSDKVGHDKAVKHLYPQTSGEQNFYAMHKWETPNDKFLDPNNGVFTIASKVFNRKANHFGHDMTDSIAAYDKVVPHDDEFDPEFPTNESTIHIKHPGALHSDLGIAQGKKIPMSKIKKAEHSSSPLERKRAQFADNAKHWHHESEENPFIKKLLGEATPVGVKKKSQVRNKGLPQRILKKKETLGSLAKDSALKLASTAFPTTTRLFKAAYNTFKKESLDERAHYALTKRGFHHVVAFKKPHKKPVQGLAVNPHEFVKEPIKEISNSLLARYQNKANDNLGDQWNKIDQARFIASRPNLVPGRKMRAMKDANKAHMKADKREKGIDLADKKLARRGLQSNWSGRTSPLDETWKYLQYPSHEDAIKARNIHHDWRDEKGMHSGNPARLMGKGKIAYMGEFKGPKPLKEGNTDDGSERMGHVGTDQMAPIQLQKGVAKKMKLTGKPPVKMNPILKQAKGPAYGTGWSPDGYVGSFGESVGEMKVKVFRTFNKYRGGKVPGEGKKHFNDSSSQVADLQKNKQDRMMEAALRSIKRKEALNEIDPATGLTLGMMALNTAAGGIISHGVGKAIKGMFKGKKKKEEVKA